MLQCCEVQRRQHILRQKQASTAGVETRPAKSPLELHVLCRMWHADVAAGILFDLKHCLQGSRTKTLHTMLCCCQWHCMNKRSSTSQWVSPLGLLEYIQDGVSLFHLDSASALTRLFITYKHFQRFHSLRKSRLQDNRLRFSLLKHCRSWVQHPPARSSKPNRSLAPTSTTSTVPSRPK